MFHYNCLKDWLSYRRVKRRGARELQRDCQESQFRVYKRSVFLQSEHYRADKRSLVIIVNLTGIYDDNYSYFICIGSSTLLRYSLRPGRLSDIISTLLGRMMNGHVSLLVFLISFREAHQTLSENYLHFFLPLFFNVMHALSFVFHVMAVAKCL